MKKSPQVVGLVLLMLVIAICLIGRGGERGKRPAVGDLRPLSPVSGEPASTDPGIAPRRRVRERSPELESTRRELRVARGELEELSRPLHEDIMSSTVNAVIKEGESLVTGGYRTRDGRHEITFITPHLETGPDGKEMVRVEARIISLGSAEVAAAGLETLATNARNTLQHAEAWSADDATETWLRAMKTPGTDSISAPEVRTTPFKPFTLSFGTDGNSFTLNGTVGRSQDGGISIRSRIERDDQQTNTAPPPGDYDD